MKNKRIGMAINYDYPDYGGMLQAYASFRKIRNLGYEPEAINADALRKDIKKRKLRYFAGNITNVSIVMEKSHIVFKKIRQKIHKELGENLDKRNMSFDNFSKEHFKISPAFKTWEELSIGCLEYSAVVVGSDQLWLPSNIAADYYTLSFVPDGMKKIAYGTSFGVSEIAAEQENKAKEYLGRIEYLSAREESGQKIIKKFTGRDVPLVCDPALLLTSEEWDDDAAPGRIVEDSYIFCYFMGNNPWQRKFVQKLKEKTGCRIVALLHLDRYIKSDEKYADITPYDVSPADFLNLVKNAEYVCTDSFHGTVFSVIYQKKFFTFKRFSEKAALSTNSRIDTLLKNLNVEDRLVKKGDSVGDMLNRKINYEAVKGCLDLFREESLRYLKAALSD